MANKFCDLYMKLYFNYEYPVHDDFSDKLKVISSSKIWTRKFPLFCR